MDGPGHKGDYWTTNQGTYIGTLVSLFEATKDRAYLDGAVKFTGTALRDAGLVAPDGVLVEKLGTSGDASLFKGVFARYLGQLRKVLAAEKAHSETKAMIARVLVASARAAIQRKDNGAFREVWHEDGGKTGFNAQIAGIAALVAAGVGIEVHFFRSQPVGQGELRIHGELRR